MTDRERAVALYAQGLSRPKIARLLSRSVYTVRYWTSEKQRERARDNMRRWEKEHPELVRARTTRYRASEKGRAAIARGRARYEQKRDADPVQRIHYLNYQTQYYRNRRIAGLEQQLKEL